jgi:hypothetical protein
MKTREKQASAPFALARRFAKLPGAGARESHCNGSEVLIPGAEGR